MIRALTRKLALVAAALAVAVASLHFAAAMAPTTSDDQDLRFWAALGVDVADLCGETGANSDHACPACRLLPAENDPVRPGQLRPFAPFGAVPTLAANQTDGAQRQVTAVSARGPPSLA